MAEVSLESLTSWRAELVESRAAGIRRLVHQNGQTVEYKSDSEMASAIRALDSEIARLSGQGSRTVKFQTSKGL